MEIHLTRNSDNGMQTLGNLKVIDTDNNNEVLFECKTIELAWKSNQKEISCIPSGIYIFQKIKKSNNIKYPHFHIINVDGRSGIKIHIANYSRELRGCIAVGDAHKDIDKDGLKDVTNSKNTLNKLLEYFNYDSYDFIKIENYFC